MIKFKSEEIKELANKLTSNSELFGDEVANVASQLATLSNSANEFGCEMEGKISDYWGGVVSVVALPDTKRNSWTF